LIFSFLQYGFYSGCTAVVALLVDKKKLFVANIGDSRCVVAVHGTKAIDMSKDHKPRDEPELLRIRAAGARVTYDGRINRDLNLSRAFGESFICTFCLQLNNIFLSSCII